MCYEIGQLQVLLTARILVVRPSDAEGQLARRKFSGPACFGLWLCARRSHNGHWNHQRVAPVWPGLSMECWRRRGQGSSWRIGLRGSSNSQLVGPPQNRIRLPPGWVASSPIVIASSWIGLMSRPCRARIPRRRSLPSRWPRNGDLRNPCALDLPDIRVRSSCGTAIEIATCRSCTDAV
jgi:hypothetical protein